MSKLSLSMACVQTRPLQELDTAPLAFDQHPGNFNVPVDLSWRAMVWPLFHAERTSLIRDRFTRIILISLHVSTNHPKLEISRPSFHTIVRNSQRCHFAIPRSEL